MRDFLFRALRFGEGKKLKVLNEKVEAVTAWEPRISRLSDAELAAKAAEFKRRLADGETLDELLPEVFAVVREASRRTLGMRHFDVQIMGGVVLFEGKIAEMKTGEGKTLVATLPVYLESLSGKGVHVVTVNDYLAKRDSEWMGKIYRFLGLSVGLIQAQMEPAFRRQAYQADVTYGTNSEFGFDHLRDNMSVDASEMVQRGHQFAIVDEVDSILIDEARTPLIISGAPERAADTYRAFAKIVPRLNGGDDYEVDEKTRTVAITEAGVAKVERALNIDNLYDHVNSQLVNHLNQALRAHALFKKDVDYVIKDGEVIIVDEFTGRLMVGRRYSEGLHQAIEAKEKVRVREENQTLATITLQNYFRMYDKLAGMTGTAATEADEFRHIYKLETVVIPTNEPMIREDMGDIVYKSGDVKFDAVVDDIAGRYEKGQPVLVGTISIERSERLSGMLKKRGIPHNVLNAKHHEREAEIIAQAGQSGTMTIATNMAGRGVDIILGGNPEGLAREMLKGKTDVTPADWEVALEECKRRCEADRHKVLAAGGLHVLGTERHEARRIDNQLRGRSGRQGDPGSSQFYLSLEDDLMRLFGSDRVRGLMDRLGLPDDYPIEHGLISRSIETAQRQVEAQNFEARKRVLEYDDVMNQQREIIYAQRQEILLGDDIGERSRQILGDLVEDSVGVFTNAQAYPETWDWDGLFAYMAQFMPTSLNQDTIDTAAITQEDLIDRLTEEALGFYDRRREELGDELFEQLQRAILLQVVDTKWREHLYEMDYLKEGIGLRAIGQRDPLIEYKQEGFAMFQQMIGSIKEDFVRYVFHADVVQEVEQPEVELLAAGGNSLGASWSGPRADTAKVGRNDPCPCGSGKKYKKCCGK